MKKYILIFIFYCIETSMLAQQHYTIGGITVDRNSNPIAAVAVILQTTDSVYVNALTTDTSGVFRFTCNVRPYRLLFQHLSYKNVIMNSSQENIGKVVLEENENALTGVVVKGERPLVKVEDGKLSYNIRQMGRDKVAHNAFDILKELPEVREKNDVITLTGAAGATAIVINGKVTSMTQSQLADYLKSIPLERIEKMEVVYNAPPQWHVGGAAINIILKKSNEYSLQGQIQGKWDNQHISSYTADGNLFVSTPKLAFDLMYNYKERASNDMSELESLHMVKGTLYDIYSTDNNNSASSSHNVYTGLEYNIKEKESISINYQGQFTPVHTANTKSTNSYFSNAKSYFDKNSYLQNIQVAYKSHSGLNLGGYYTSYSNNASQQMQYDKRGIYSDVFNYSTYQKINQINLYADMVHTLWKKWELTYGVKYSYVDNANQQQYIDKEDSKKDYTTTSSTYESTARVYAGLKKSFLDEKLNISLSLTGEYYKINDSKKNSLIPGGTITYTPSKNHTLQLAYMSQKAYPSYWSRQEYTTSSDEYTVSYGNPQLLPSQTNYAQLMYLFKNKYMFQASYYIVDNFFISQSYQSPDELKMIYKTVNVDFTSAWYFMLTIPFSIGNVLTTNLEFCEGNERYKCSDWCGIAYDRNKWMSIVTARNTIRVCDKPKIVLNLTAYYKTPTIQGLWDLSSTWGVNAGAKWNFNNDKCVLSFHCDDIFETEMPTIKCNYATQNQFTNINFYQRQCSFSFTYQFKGYRNRSKKNVDTSRYGI